MTESGVKFRCYPSQAQQRLALQWIGHQRFIKNAKVREREYFLRFEHKAPAQWGLRPKDDQAYSQFVTDDSAFLKDVPSQLLRNGAYRFMQALTRYRKGLGGAPKVQGCTGRQSVLITKELFTFTELPDSTPKEPRYQLQLGTAKFPFGVLKFKAHRPYKVPNMLVLAVDGDRWTISFCYDNPPVDADGQPVILRTQEELLYELQGREDLSEVIWAGDRGVAIPVAGSDGRHFDYSDTHKARMAKAETRKKRYQRRLARCQKGSNNQKKLRKKVAKQYRYQANVRNEFAHQTSHELVADERYQVFAFEDLKTKNMTAAPKAKQDAKGRYTANGAAAKAGLNAAILRSSWGIVHNYTAYKAARANKVTLTVPPHHSSQECAACGHVDAAGRKSQAVFCCTACGHTANADDNAGQVLKKRAFTKIREGSVENKKPKTVRFRKKKRLEMERLEVTSESGANQSSLAHGANEAQLRSAA